MLKMLRRVWNRVVGCRSSRLSIKKVEEVEM